MHELIWLADKTYERYGLKQVEHNLVDAYHKIYVDGTNFWSEVFPLFESIVKDTHVYIVAGDVGGGPDTVSAYFAQADNVTFLATGMGETIDENFMQIAITQNGKLVIDLVPLNSWVERVTIVIQRLSDSIVRLFRKTVWQLTKVKIDAIEDY